MRVRVLNKDVINTAIQQFYDYRYNYIRISGLLGGVDSCGDNGATTATGRTYSKTFQGSKYMLSCLNVAAVVNYFCEWLDLLCIPLPRHCMHLGHCRVEIVWHCAIVSENAENIL